MAREEDPDAEIPTDPVTKQPKYYVVSASQLKTWWACRRKWGWTKIAKLSEPSGRGAGLGTMMHDQLEKVLRDGAGLNFSIKDPFGTYPAEVAQPGLQYLPAPQSDGLLVEKYFKFEVPKIAPEDPTIYVRGYKDYQVAPSAREDGLPHVGDHKSCGNWQYALTAEDLAEDVQAIIYAYHELLTYPDASACTLQWTYYGTKKPYKALPVSVTVTREHVLALIEEVFVGSRELVTTLSLRPEVLALPANADECGKYGGCPFQKNCNLSPRERRPFSMSNTTVSTSNLVDRIAARKAQESGAPAAAPGLTPLQAKIAAAKAAKAAGAPPPAPAPEEVLKAIEESGDMPATPPAWALETTPYTGAKPAATSTMPASDQPINCPSDFQPPPANASTPVEIAPELAAAITPTGKGRPKGSKNATKAAEVPALTGVDPVLVNEFLAVATEFMKLTLADYAASKAQAAQ